MTLTCTLNFWGYVCPGSFIAWHIRAAWYGTRQPDGPLVAHSTQQTYFCTALLACPGLPCASQNTTNKGGGAWYSHAALQEISQLCRARGIALHLDGARVFNAIVESKQYRARDLGQVSRALALFPAVSAVTAVCKPRSIFRLRVPLPVLLSRPSVDPP